MLLATVIHIDSWELVSAGIGLLLMGCGVFGLIFGRDREQMQEENKRNLK